MRKPCFNVIPMTDFVKLDHKEDYRLDREYKVRFVDTKSGGFKLFGAILKLIGLSSLLSYSWLIHLI